MTHCTIIDWREGNATSLAGRIHTTYDRIVAAYGEPNSPGAYVDEIREWTLTTPEGVATIYAYKPYGKTYGDIFTWNVGSHHKGDVVRYIEADVVQYLRTRPSVNESAATLRTEASVTL